MTSTHTHPAAPPEHEREIPPGVIVVSTTKRGYAAVIEVIRHRGGLIRNTRDGLALISCDSGEKRRFAYYTTDVVVNGWEPCDQPSPAAYLPLRYAALDRVDLASDGILLIERRSLRENVWRAIAPNSDDTTVVLLEEAKPEEVQSVVVAGLRAAAMPSDALKRCSEAMGDALAAVG